MMPKCIRSRVQTATLLSAFAAFGCAAVAPKELHDARDAYRGASKGPAAQFNPAQLHTAQQALALAEKTFEEEGDSPGTRDRAYVALRKAQLADTQGRMAQENAQIEGMKKDADKAQATELAHAKTDLAAEEQRRKAAEEAARKAAEELSRLASVKQEERGMVITLSGSVLFETDKSELLPDAQRRLSDVAKALIQGNPEAQIVVEGHTDSRGSQGHNLELSARRAESVRTYLVSQGVESGRIRSEGLGFSRPVADNKSAEGRANNRRVEIVVQPNQSPMNASPQQAVGT